MKKRCVVRLFAQIAVLICLCTGCSLDVESFLQPPRAQGEHQAIQLALETYLGESGTAVGRYSLLYPSTGAYTSAFVLCDSSGRPTQEDGDGVAMAVAFYALAAAPEQPHVNLLYRQDGTWISADDRVGYGADIQQVAFGDLDGDGLAELLTGWSTYNSQDHRLAAFSMKDGLRVFSSDLVYTQLYAGDITGTGRDSLLLFRIGSENMVTATLQQMRDGQLVSTDTVRLDGQIQQFKGMTLCSLAQGVQGLYVDALKTADTLMTEILYYADGKLHAPLYDAASNATTETARAASIASRDVDGDGRVEIPHCRLLPGHTVADKDVSTAWFTTWRAWDYATGLWKTGPQGIVNIADGYMIWLDEAVQDTMTTAYDANSRTLDLQDTETKEFWLRLSTNGRTEAPAQGMERITLFEREEDALPLVVWFNPDVLDEREIRIWRIQRLQGGVVREEDISL